MTENKYFGIRENKYNYIERIGAYGIPFKDGKVSLVKSNLGYFILGGGIEEGESDAECLKREVIEEAGKNIRIGEFLEEVVEYVHVDGSKRSYKKIMRFYDIELLDDVDGKIEIDHELVNLSISDAVEKLYLKGQAYAIKEYAK